jgi:hypothetical protein
MAKTAAERKREQRKRQQGSYDRERLDVVMDARRLIQLRMYADYHGITQTEALERMIDGFSKSIPFDEKQKMWAHAEAKEQAERRQPAGDTKTIPLPFDAPLA